MGHSSASLAVRRSMSTCSKLCDSAFNDGGDVGRPCGRGYALARRVRARGCAIQKWFLGFLLCVCACGVDRGVYANARVSWRHACDGVRVVQIEG